MELTLFTSFPSVTRLSSSKSIFYGRIKFIKQKLGFNFSNLNPRFVRIAVNNHVRNSKKGGDSVHFHHSEINSQFIEVIGIGSRVDSVVDFCLDSPFQLSSSLRFWNINVNESLNVQLQERVFDKDVNPRILEASQFLQSCSISTAVILVACAGYGLDYVTAIEILQNVKSRNGFAVAICLRPFSFEGQRRQDEVKDLIGKIQGCTNFCIDIDTDMLLKKDLVTLDEALKTANSAVLLAMNAVSVLISDMHIKLIDEPHTNAKELKASEILKILESYKEAKIGFGAGNSIKSSILQALYDCPFIGAGVENLNGIVICNIASSDFIEDRDFDTSLLTFRQTAKYKGEIIISILNEPSLDHNMIVTTIVTVGCNEVQTPQRSGLLSRLAQHFPFVSKLLRGQHQQSNDSEQSNDNGGINELKGSQYSKESISPETAPMESRIAVEDIAEGSDQCHEEHKKLPNRNYHDINSSSVRSYEAEYEYGSLNDNTNSFNFYDQISEETPSLQRDPLTSWNLGPGYQIAQEWAKERARDTSMLDNMSIFHLPVGVRSPEDNKEVSYAAPLLEPKTEGVIREQKQVNSSISAWGALGDAGFLLVRDFYNNASTMLKSRNIDVPKKQGVLSVRAASMLEAERDSPKRWSPVTEMQYRGGIYRGRCQGGLPEGKGQFILEDGSIYDGMWRYGKRSGPGAFYFCNGDVFQGSWRDDVMHGKGWFYFHTGDRWFTNFWKGKANGESRFYSKSGEVFFGNFKDGWRHGHFLCIDVDGERCVETWDEGNLVGRKQLDSESGVDAG